jgi:two-component system, chemotaxis family, sensor kinase CheA
MTMSDYLDPNNEELLKDFFVEAYSQVDLLEQNILSLENDPGNHDAVDEIFRAAHTLKGGAATVAMTELSQFTHLVEDLLDAIRSKETSLTGQIVDSLLSAVDVIKAMLASRSQGKTYSKDISKLTSELRAYIPEGKQKKGAAKPKQEAAKPAEPKTAPARPAASTAAVAAPDKSLTEYEALELREAAGAGMNVLRVRVSFNEDNVMNTVGGIQVFAILKDCGKVLKTIPDFEALYGDTFYPDVDYFIGTDRGKDEIYKKLQINDVVLGSEISEVGEPAAAKKPEKAAPVAQAAAAAAAAPESVAAQLAKQEEDEAGKDDAKKAAQQAGSILRVDSRRIDNLLNLVSETVITKATFNQISSSFGSILSEFQIAQFGYREKMKSLFDSIPELLAEIQAGKSVKEVKKQLTEQYAGVFTAFDVLETGLKSSVGKFRSTAQNLGRITGELQEGVMRIRMVPISQIFSRFPRLVRDLSKSLDKKINLVIEGEDTELDKSVIEDLLDPLMHSVRNALDHGIEGPNERLAAGKPEEGMVLLKASNEGNMIVIEIADDGKGIDVDAVRQKAIDRGIIHPSKSLTDLEAFNLIFEPGFSTAKTVTNISGRGVGLDVVRTQVEKLNGTVTVSSQRGKGTKFVIKLPLTLAIIQGLLVRVGREIYSIPITSVLESHRIKPEDIKMIDNYEVINIRSDVISLLRLDRLFRIKTQEQRDYCFVVIVGTADKKMGLMVDSLIGEEDVVIKPLRDSFTSSPGIAGASILGDGSVSLIIDVSQLLELGLKKELEERRRREATIR